MITRTNLIIGSMLLCVSSCTSPTAPSASHTLTPTFQPGKYQAQINQQVIQQEDTAVYLLKEWGGSTIYTPNGCMFHLLLPDSTNILLNAATRLTFSQETETPKKVSLTGEVFLTTTTSPVQLKTGSVTLKIPPQTTVNIKSYTEDPTTAISPEKSTVIIQLGKKDYQIRAGKQAIIQKGKITLQTAKQTVTGGWRSGLFTEAEPLPLLREVSRWYDVPLYGEARIPDIQLEGALPRSARLRNLITILQANDIPVQLDTIQPALILKRK